MREGQPESQARVQPVCSYCEAWPIAGCCPGDMPSSQDGLRGAGCMSGEVMGQCHAMCFTALALFPAVGNQASCPCAIHMSCWHPKDWSAGLSPAAVCDIVWGHLWWVVGILVIRGLASLGWFWMCCEISWSSEVCAPPAASQKGSRASPESDVDGADSSHRLLLEYITCRHGLLLVSTCNVLSSSAVEIIRLVGQSNYSSFPQDIF